MSPSPNRGVGGGAVGIVVALTPGYLGIQQRTREGALAETVLAYPLPDNLSDFAPALRTLNDWADRPDQVGGVSPDPQNGFPLKGALLSFLFSSAYVRTALIPWSAVRLSGAEESLLIAARFNETYGPMTGWKIVADGGQYGQARIACAIPQALVDGLVGFCASRGSRCGPLQPYFVASWNRWQQLGKEPAFLHRHTDTQHSIIPPIGFPHRFAVAESGTIVMASHTAPGWSSLHQGRASNPGALAAFIARESLLQGQGQNLPVYLHAPGQSEAQWAQLRAAIPASIQLHRLDLHGVAGIGETVLATEVTNEVSRINDWDESAVSASAMANLGELGCREPVGWAGRWSSPLAPFHWLKQGGSK